jgi:alkylation response protein AidB-like acyl-CoA dehydrogenase
MGEPMDQQQWVRIELAHLARRAQVARSTYLGSALSVCSFGITEPMSLIPDIPIANWLLNQPRITQLRHRVMASHSMNRIFKWAADRQTASNRDVVTAYADVAKVSCTDLALENCQRALSLMGKEGLRHENGAEKLLRDVKLLQIYEGTNQVNMLDFVKRHLVRQFH